VGAVAPFLLKKIMIEEIKKIIEPAIMQNNCFLWGIEILRGKKNPTLRVFIDSYENANIEDCENISKDLNYEVSLESILGDDFILEVSTPGINRKFFYKEQLNQYIGEEFELRLRKPINGDKNIKGHLINMSNDILSIKNKKRDYELDFNDLDLCKLNPNYSKLIKEINYAK
tara:strand:- start:317 stop:832 length:516 start_codon:yes stop_codon:yes gene_type:complete